MQQCLEAGEQGGKERASVFRAHLLDLAISFRVDESSKRRTGVASHRRARPVDRQIEQVGNIPELREPIGLDLGCFRRTTLIQLRLRVFPETEWRS